MSAITPRQVLQACEQCRAQWAALRRAHGQQRHPARARPLVPQSPIERLMENTGCDAFQAIVALQAAQDAELVILDEAGRGEPWITKQGRQVLDEDPAYLGYWGNDDCQLAGEANANNA